MRKFFILFLAVGILLSFNSCEDDKNTGDPIDVDEQTGEPEEVSPLTPEEHKTNIASVGVELVGEMDDLAKSDATEAAINLFTLMEGEEEEEYSDSYKSAVAFSTLKVLSDFGQNEATVFDIMRNLRTLNATLPDTPIEEEYKDEFAGTWEWDASSEDFEQTASGDQAIFKFPASASSESNNAVFTVTAFDWKEISGDLTDDELEEVPVSLAANLKVDGNTAMEISFSGDYNEKGIPQSIDVSLKVATYEFTTSVTNDFTDASMESTMKHGDKQILKLSAGVNGDFSEANIEDNTYTELDTSDYGYCVEWNDDYSECIDYEYDVWEETYVDVENILESSYGFMEVLNLRIGGEVDAKNMILAEKDLDWDKKADEESNVDAEVEAMNEYMDFYAAYVDENKRIATVEFIKVRSDESWEHCEWNYDTQEYENCADYYDYWVEGNFIFGDDSKVNAETYFEDGFKSFIDELNTFIRDMNSEYSDYGMDMEPIDYDGK